jgi:hypothetical protein
MIIDRNRSPLEIHESIYDQVLSLGLKHRFKTRENFEDKWYREGNEGPYILFPHTSIDDPEKALGNCPYPNAWIRHLPATGELEYGIAFWSVASIDQRFANFSHARNEEQRSRVLSLLKGLPDGWLFQVCKRKKAGAGEIVYENPCNKMGQDEFTKTVADVLAWRTQWKKEAERGDTAVPAINLMRGQSMPEESDQRIAALFAAYDELVEMAPVKTLADDLKKSKKDLETKIGNLTKNLQSSNYKKEIETRLKGLRQELEQLGCALWSIRDGPAKPDRGF